MTLSPALSYTPRPAEVSRLGLLLAVIAPVAVGSILVAKSGVVAPLAGAPAIALGVAVATSPALYIALAATGAAPAPARVARAFAIALAAFGVALCGFVLPAAFLALSSLSPETSIVVATAALGGAAVLGVWRLAIELELRGGLAQCVFVVWAAATLGVAGRLWIDLAQEVML